MRDESDDDKEVDDDDNATADGAPNLRPHRGPLEANDSSGRQGDRTHAVTDNDDDNDNDDGPLDLCESSDEDDTHRHDLLPFTESQP